MKRKKIVAFALLLAMAATLMCGCGKDNNTNNSGNEGNSNGTTKASVYYLNFKPEVADVWEDIADTYEDETGVEVKVVTAASGTYESTLKSEIAKKSPPTIFQINGPVGYQSWKQYCRDLSDTSLYKNLTDQDMAVKDGDGVYGIPYVVEGYGIIYNDAIMKKYFGLSEKSVKISATDEITDFKTLKAVVEDMTKLKGKLGIDGVFSSTSFAAGEDWRWQTHLANVPLFYEFQEDGVADKDNIDFRYSDNFKNIFDLYLKNSVTESGLVGSKSVEDSMAEFALGKSVMVQNGNWGWSQINDVDGNKVKSEDVKFLPIYTGMEEDAGQGLCIGTENYICINNQVSEEQQNAAIKFLDWLITSDKGKNYVTEKLGFISPFKTFSKEEQPSDPLAQEVVRYMNDAGKASVSWNFTTFPSQTFKDNFGASLLEYATGKKEWNNVVKDMKADWSVEKEV